MALYCVVCRRLDDKLLDCYRLSPIVQPPERFCLLYDPVPRLSQAVAMGLSLVSLPKSFPHTISGFESEPVTVKRLWLLNGTGYVLERVCST
jgi:hypothetical protein